MSDEIQEMTDPEEHKIDMHSPPGNHQGGGGDQTETKSKRPTKVGQNDDDEDEEEEEEEEEAAAAAKGRGEGGVSGSRGGASRIQKLLLYQASINCNWEEVLKIFTADPRMQYDQTLNEKNETALHVVALAKANPKKMRNFVKNLLQKMEHDSIEATTTDGHTALYLAVVAGNLEFVKIMVPTRSGDGWFDLGRRLLDTAGGGNFRHMPLSAAALYGNYEVVKYIFNNFDTDFTENHRKLIKYCVENDMFDIALEIVTKYIEHITPANANQQPENKASTLKTCNRCQQPLPARNLTFPADNKPPYNGGMILRALARKPEALNEAESTFFEKLRTWSWNCLRCRRTTPYMKKKSQALKLLRLVWRDILDKSQGDHENIRSALVGPLGSIRDYNTVSGWDVQAIQLQNIITTYDTALSTAGHSWPIDLLKAVHRFRIKKYISGALDVMHRDTHEIINRSPNKQDDKPVSSKEHEFQELRTLIFNHIANMKKEIKKGPDFNLLHQQIEKMRKENKIIIEKYARETPPAHIIAAELGNTNFLIELIKQYPDLIWQFDGNNQSIFHIAIRHRHERIFNLLHDLGTQKDLMTIYKDPDGNSMLHLVGKIPRAHRLEEVSGAALQMQRELLWFKEVEKMIPRSYSENENRDGLTPHELFKKEHKDLCKQGEEWIKGTASQGMVVAALVATMVFTAAFTVPGGYDQRDDDTKGYHYGKPVFHSESTFMVFVMADAVSLALSCLSILSFLSVLTSRFREDDFLQSLFKRLNWGLVTLLFSIATMMLAFGISFFVLYSKGSLWVPIVICAFAAVVIFLYFCLYWHLFKDVFTSWFWNEDLFKHKKRVLFCDDPYT